MTLKEQLKADIDQRARETFRIWLTDTIALYKMADLRVIDASESVVTLTLTAAIVSFFECNTSKKEEDLHKMLTEITAVLRPRLAKRTRRRK